MRPLPSASSARDLVLGRPGALGRAAAHTALRALLVGAGAAALGLRGPSLIRASIGGAIGIEVFVLSWTYYHWKTSAPVVVPMREAAT